MPKAKVDGFALHYRVDGRDGAPWLTFGHALTADMSMWAPQVEALERDYRILRYDMRGHGLSDAPAGDYRFADLARDVVALWDALGIERSHFCGLSMGGMTGLGLALDHAGRLNKAVICDCRADAPPDIIKTWRERIEAVRVKGLAAVVDGNLQRWFTTPFRAQNPALLDRIRTTILGTSIDGYLGCAHALITIDYLPRVADIKAPVLFIVGEADGPQPAAMRVMHERVRGSRLTIIDDAAHLPNLERPEAFNRALKAFLAR